MTIPKQNFEIKKVFFSFFVDSSGSNSKQTIEWYRFLFYFPFGLGITDDDNIYCHR